MDYLVDKKCYIPNTEVVIRSIVKKEGESKPIPVFTKKTNLYKVHPSIVKVSRMYPKMKLPRSCLSSDVAPIVEMEIDQVENYFKKQRLDFNLCAKKALASAKRVNLNKEQKSPKQNKMLVLPKDIKITKISKSKTIGRIDKLQETIVCNEAINNIKEPQKTSSRSPRKESYSRSPVRPNVKRKLTESPSKEKTHVGSETDTNCTTLSKKRVTTEISLQENSKNVPGREFVKYLNRGAINTKRKINSNEGIPKEKMNDQQTVLSEIKRFPTSPTTRKRKLFSAENFSEKNIDGEANVSTNTTPKNTQFDNEKITVKQDPSKDTPIEESKTNHMITSENCSSHKDSDISVSEKDENDDCESLTSVGKSVPLFVCELCNSVQYNMYELKKHQNKHMRCQFCKIRLRSLENKKYHVENVCIIKKMMNDLPHVALIKVEYNETIRKRYPEAFVGFAPLSNEKNVELEDHQEDVRIMSIKKALFKECPPERLEIIEILSDDEVLPLSVTEKEQPPIIPDISSNVFAKACEKGVLKNLLTLFQRSTSEAGTQTDLPTNCNVKIMESNMALLKDLFKHVNIYNIPVKMQPGEFSVTYDFNVKPKSAKKLCLWKDLSPINIQSKTEDCNSLNVMSEKPQKDSRDRGT